jgi:CNT family concentrative nucleoside transporter
MDTAVTPLPPPAAAEARLPPTPASWRWAIGLAVVGLFLAAYLTQEQIGSRGQATAGVLCFLGVVAAFSSNLRAVNWRTIGWGIALQILLALFILKLEVFGHRPGQELFQALVSVVKKFLEFTNAGSQFVFGPLADPGAMNRVFPDRGFVFAFAALPTVVFVASFFTVLYYFGVLQYVVRLMARAMMYLMRTSGAETLSVSANVFMGQTEAPLIVKPYVAGMTRSELLSLMVGGMAHISGGLMAVYIGMGADPLAILATSVMAAPCSLYLSKLFLPELGQPETRGEVKTVVEQQHSNVIDAASAGASDGMRLAINIAAMLIAFLAFIALFDYVLGLVPSGRSLQESLEGATGWELAQSAAAVLVGFAVFVYLGNLLVRWLWPGRSLLQPFGKERGWTQAGNGVAVLGELVVFVVLLDLALANLPPNLSLQMIFSWVFWPVAFLMGVEGADIPRVADLLGIKLVANEFVAYTKLTGEPYRHLLGGRDYVLATYALTGFANFSSIGIQLGGIGAMAPSRRHDLARLGGKALFVGFLVTLINASIAGMLI